MARITDTVTTINTTIRTLLATVLLGGVGFAGWLAYDAFHQGDAELKAKQQQLATARTQLESLQSQLQEKEGVISTKVKDIQRLTAGLAQRDSQIQQMDGQIDKLGQQVEASRQRIDQLETSMHLLKVDHRVAQLTVVDQTTDPESERVRSTIEFVEVNDDGAPIADPRTFEIEGDLVYVDFWIVKFDEKYVEQADVHRSTSICLFRRIFGEYQEPREGYVLDQVGSRPHAYARGGKPTEFETSIWNDFWNIANDPEKAREKGIRAAHGEAVATRLRKGKKYRVELRASGGLSIAPIAEADGV
jgi:multidrug efflux pump subunit AcrA (membrane-fusion protein)